VIPFCTDVNTGEHYYFAKKQWCWAGEVIYLEHNFHWLKSICTRHGIEYAVQDNQRTILFTHKYHKFNTFGEYVEFLNSFFPIIYSHEKKLT